MNDMRFEKLLLEAVEKFQLDFQNATILTEAATGYFCSTSLLAGLSNGNVIAVAKDSEYGSALDAINFCKKWAQRLGIQNRIIFSEEPAQNFAHKSDIITNLGFVRPINDVFISKLSSDACICLMWEPWEIRDYEIDTEFAAKKDISILATNESHPNLETFKFVGLLAVKLLLQSDIEVLKSRIAIYSSEPFHGPIKESIEALGGNVVSIDALNLDAIIVAEHRDPKFFTSEKCLNFEKLRKNGTKIIHICGNIDFQKLEKVGISKFPSRNASFGKMTVTTAYVGPRPIIELHAAGLKIGALYHASLKSGFSKEDAIKKVLDTGLAVETDFDL